MSDAVAAQGTQGLALALTSHTACSGATRAPSADGGASGGRHVVDGARVASPAAFLGGTVASLAGSGPRSAEEGAKLAAGACQASVAGACGVGEGAWLARRARPAPGC